MRSKKFRGPSRINRSCWQALIWAGVFVAISLLREGSCLLWAAAAEGVPAGLQKLPALEHVGVIPLQMGAAFEEDGHLKAQGAIIGQAFSLAIRESQQFHVFPDELIQDMWQGHASRKELADDYELSAYMHLTLSRHGDTVTFTARLLGPELEPYLQENDHCSAQELGQADASSLEERVRLLVFRLLNRLPIDVMVTSVQGPYITLSGGKEQGLAEGDSLELVRVWIQSLHPALKTWRDFYTRPLGKARLVEVKENVAIAKLTELVKADTIAVGDAAKVSGIRSRLQFARQEAHEVEANPMDEEIITPGLAPSEQDSKALAKPPSPAPPSSPKDGSQPLALLEDEDEKPSPPASEQTQPLVLESVEKPAAGEPLPPAPAAKPSAGNQNLQAELGHWGWTLRGPASMGSRLLCYHTLNILRAQLLQPLRSQFYWAFGGSFALGKIHNRTDGFSTLEGDSRLYWEEPFVFGKGLIQSWRVGFKASLNLLGVRSESFKGYELLQGGLLFGLSGQFSFLGRENAPPLTWSGEFSLSNLSLGTIRYSHGNQAIRSGLDWQLYWAATHPLDAATAFELGGGFLYGRQYLVASNYESSAFSRYSLFLLGRWQL